MRHLIISRRLTVILVIGIVLLGILWAGRAHAQPSTSYDLTWSTFDGGGCTTCTGGIYSLGGTIGQPDAGHAAGGIYSLDGGFWGQVMSALKVFLPLINK